MADTKLWMSSSHHQEMVGEGKVLNHYALDEFVSSLRNRWLGKGVK